MEEFLYGILDAVEPFIDLYIELRDITQEKISTLIDD